MIHSLPIPTSCNQRLILQIKWPVSILNLIHFSCFHNVAVRMMSSFFMTLVNPSPFPRPFSTFANTLLTTVTFMLQILLKFLSWHLSLLSTFCGDGCCQMNDYFSGFQSKYVEWTDVKLRSDPKTAPSHWSDDADEERTFLVFLSPLKQISQKLTFIELFLKMPYLFFICTIILFIFWNNLNNFY